MKQTTLRYNYENKDGDLTLAAQNDPIDILLLGALETED